MNTPEHRQQRMVVGWWLGVDPIELLGDSNLEGHLHDITEAFEHIVATGRAGELAPMKTNDHELKKRLLRVEKALSGVAIAAIAKEEYVSSRAISGTIKYTLARIAFVQEEVSK